MRDTGFVKGMSRRIGAALRAARINFQTSIRRPTESIFVVIFWAMLIFSSILFVQFGLDLLPPEFSWDYLSAENGKNAEILRNILLAGAGLVGSIFGVFQIANSSKRTRISQEAVDVSREEERNTRFVSAIQQLSSDNTTVTVGGIHALERLALEEGASYYSHILQILAGYVRERTNAPDYPSHYAVAALSQIEDDDAEETRGLCVPYGGSEYDNWRPPSEDVKTAVRALSNIWSRKKKEFVGISAPVSRGQISEADVKRIDLSTSKLPFADLSGLDLSYWNFVEARLDHASLLGANIEGIELHRASIFKAELSHTSGNCACFFGAMADGVHMSRAKLHFADFSGTSLVGAELEYGEFVAAAFDQTDMKFCAISGSNFKGAHDLNKSELENAIWPTGMPPRLPPPGSRKISTRANTPARTTLSNLFIIRHRGSRCGSLPDSFLLHPSWPLHLRWRR